MQTTVKLYTLRFDQVATYLAATLFAIGNIILPQLFHLVPQGGITWLPIYFFTLIAAYKYGWQAGLLTAVLSPTVNSILFGMPAPAMVPVILTKSILLATAAGYIAHRFRRVSILLIASAVLLYQALGTLCEWAIVGDLYRAIQDLRIGFPGILLQIFGGYLFIKYLIRR